MLPALGCALLVVIALALLGPRPDHRPRTAGAQPTATMDATPPSAEPPPSLTAPSTTPPDSTTSTSASPPASAPAPTAAPTASQVMPSGAFAAGDGPAADPAIEAQFQADHPSDLSPQDAAQVRALTVQVWMAETTGQGRDHWPAYFPPTQVPLRAYTQVRVQAVSAHTSGERLIVQLLWAGADPSGTYQDRRPAILSLARTATGWEPVR
ncbi:hypothetical protein [Kitasatospora sp. NPDC086791]|uniref:hypothetical protein n=1 Tax=Kitasatospora sp. NPDC086791 TaxID=3155178 RepID=UPI0034360B82